MMAYLQAIHMTSHEGDIRLLIPGDCALNAITETYNLPVSVSSVKGGFKTTRGTSQISEVCCFRAPNGNFTLTIGGHLIGVAPKAWAENILFKAAQASLYANILQTKLNHDYSGYTAALSKISGHGEESSSTIMRPDFTAKKKVRIVLDNQANPDKYDNSLLLQTPEITASEGTEIDLANPADVKLLSAKTHRSSESHMQTTNGIWQSQSGEGQYDEFIHLPRFMGPLKIAPNAKIMAEIIPDSLPTGIGYEWIEEFKDLGIVNWQVVREIHDSWDYHQEGLTPAGAALVSIAVGIATWGVGGKFAVAAGLASKGGAVASMASAGFTSLCSQASISLINNQGNIGKTLKDLASSDTLKSLAVSVASAGLLKCTSYVFNLPENPQGLFQHAQVAAAKTFSSTLSQAVIGHSSRKLFETAGLSFVGNTLHGWACNGVCGMRSDVGPVIHKFLHLAAAAGREAIISKGDLRSMALAGAAAAGAETFAEALLPDYKNLQEQIYNESIANGRPITGQDLIDAYHDRVRQIIDITRGVTALATVLAGENPHIALNAATSALENNFVFLAAALPYLPAAIAALETTLLIATAIGTAVVINETMDNASAAAPEEGRQDSGISSISASIGNSSAACFIDYERRLYLPLKLPIFNLGASKSYSMGGSFSQSPSNSTWMGNPSTTYYRDYEQKLHSSLTLPTFNLGASRPFSSEASFSRSFSTSTSISNPSAACFKDYEQKLHSSLTLPTFNLEDSRPSSSGASSSRFDGGVGNSYTMVLESPIPPLLEGYEIAEPLPPLPGYAPVYIPPLLEGYEIAKPLPPLPGYAPAPALPTLPGYDELPDELRGMNILVSENQEEFSLPEDKISKIYKHDRFGKFYQNKDDNLFYTKDRAQHAGSAWKVYKETGSGLEWIRDLDQYGKKIEKKHKGDTGKSIPKKELNGVNKK